jgi:hypothetical protein
MTRYSFVNRYSIPFNFQAPSVLIDGFVPVESVVTSEVLGEVRLHVAVGTAAQVLAGSAKKDVPLGLTKSSTTISEIAVQTSPEQRSVAVDGGRDRVLGDSRASSNGGNDSLRAHSEDEREDEPETEPFVPTAIEIPPSPKTHPKNVQSFPEVFDSALDLRVRHVPDEPLDLSSRHASRAASPVVPSTTFTSAPVGITAVSRRKMKVRVSVLHAMGVEVADDGSSCGRKRGPHAYVSVEERDDGGDVRVSPACTSTEDPVWNWDVEVLLEAPSTVREFTM